MQFIDVNKRGDCSIYNPFHRPKIKVATFLQNLNFIFKLFIPLLSSLFV